MEQETNHKYVREKSREAFYLKYSLRRQERLDLIQEVGLHGMVLFEYYLRLASIEDVELTDEGAAGYFGWNVHTARRYRRALINKGWLFIDKGRLGNGSKVNLYYLGKEEVLQAKNQGTKANEVHTESSKTGY